MSTPQKLLHIARMVFTPLSLLVIGVFVWEARSTLENILRQGQWNPLLLALLLWVASNLLAPLASRQIFRACGIHRSYRELLVIHCSRLPAKYLPGGIWHSVGRADDYLAMGNNASKVGLFFVLENFLVVAVTLLMSAWIVQPLVKVPLLSTLVNLLSPLMALLLVALPFVLRVVVRGSYRIDVAPYLSAILLLLLYWSLLGVTFVCYLSAFEGLPLAGSAVELAAVYVFSWVLGYLALFAPQGIGVAEFVSSTLLAGNVGGAVLGFLVGFRLLALVADLLTWQGIALFRRVR